MRDKESPKPVSNDAETVKKRKFDSFIDRLIMRLYCTSPTLMVYLQNSRADPHKGVVELVFNELPADILPAVKSLCGQGETSMFKFRDEVNGHGHVAVRLKPTEADLKDL